MSKTNPSTKYQVPCTIWRCASVLSREVRLIVIIVFQFPVLYAVPSGGVSMVIGRTTYDLPMSELWLTFGWPMGDLWVTFGRPMGRMRVKRHIAKGDTWRCCLKGKRLKNRDFTCELPMDIRGGVFADHFVGHVTTDTGYSIFAYADTNSQTSLRATLYVKWLIMVKLL